jgi:NADP-dependent 3-hydroxy acid dehydrogenase YdfG
MKKAIITGASRGMGAAIARTLAANGFAVHAVARDTQALKDLCDEINNKGGMASYTALDISDPAATAHWLEGADTPDLLVNNAGIGVFKPFDVLSVGDFDMLFHLNVRACFQISQGIAAKMIKTGRGQIISIVSDAGKRVFPNGSLYCASKAAQNSLMQALRTELQPAGIRLTQIFPGLTDSYFNGGIPGSDRKSDWLQVNDIAAAVLYVANAADHIVLDEIMLHPRTQNW